MPMVRKMATAITTIPRIISSPAMLSSSLRCPQFFNQCDRVVHALDEHIAPHRDLAALGLRAHDVARPADGERHGAHPVIRDGLRDDAGLALVLLLVHEGR